MGQQCWEGKNKIDIDRARSACAKMCRTSMKEPGKSGSLEKWREHRGRERDAWVEVSGETERWIHTGRQAGSSRSMCHYISDCDRCIVAVGTCKDTHCSCNSKSKHSLFGKLEQDLCNKNWASAGRTRKSPHWLERQDYIVMSNSCQAILKGTFPSSGLTPSLVLQCRRHAEQTSLIGEILCFLALLGWVVPSCS